MAILSSSSIFSNRVFSLDVSPRRNSIEDFGILNNLDRNSTRHLFAFPSTGGAVILIFTPSSVLIISFLEAFGEILKLTIKPSSFSLVILMYEIFQFFLKSKNKIRIIIISCLKNHYLMK